METQQTRTPIFRREAFLYDYVVLNQLGGTRITAAMGTADQAALNVNGARIVAEDTVTNLLAQIAAAGTLTLANQPDFARNVVIAAHNDSGAPKNLFEGTTTFRVTGTFRGETVYEDINVTSTGANKAVADTKYRAWAGSQPFQTITNIKLMTPTASVPEGALKMAVGIGVKMGLPAKPYSRVAADVVQWVIDGTVTAISTLLDTTYDTVDINTIADAKAWQILYWINLSDVRRRLFNK